MGVTTAVQLIPSSGQDFLLVVGWAENKTPNDEWVSYGTSKIATLWAFEWLNGRFFGQDLTQILARMALFVAGRLRLPGYSEAIETSPTYGLSKKWAC